METQRLLRAQQHQSPLPPILPSLDPGQAVQLPSARPDDGSFPRHRQEAHHRRSVKRFRRAHPALKERFQDQHQNAEAHPVSKTALRRLQAVPTIDQRPEESGFAREALE